MKVGRVPGDAARGGSQPASPAFPNGVITMTTNAKWTGFSMPLIAVALVSGVIGVGVTSASAGNNGAVRCEIDVRDSGGGVTLQGRVYAKTGVEGSYRMRVSSTSGSNINQSGGFSASPGSPGDLGLVSLGGSGSYTARLEVSWDGGATTCTERGGI